MHRLVRITDHCFLLFLLALLLVLSSFSNRIHAQVSTNITSDNSLGTQVTPNGNVYDITGGTRPDNGTNLFHSFGQFSVGGGDIANFLNDTGAGTNNILGRVTGGDPSSIFGTIQTTDFPGANLFLLNPAGVIFGPSASLNVSGSFYTSTADFLRLGEDGIFYADLGEESVLTIANPTAFGFLSDNPQGLTLDQSQLVVEADQTLGLVGGDVDMSGAQLTAPNGNIILASVASPGEVTGIGGTEIQTNAPQLGNIGITDQASLKTDGPGGGTVVIRGGNLMMVDSQITANVGGEVNGLQDNGPGEGIDIQVNQDVVIQDGAFLETNVTEEAAPGIGSGGVRIKADRIEILETAPNFNFPFTGIRSSVAPGSEGGSSGDVHLEANSILVQGALISFFTGIETETFGPESDAGDIILKTTGDIDIDNGLLSSTTVTGRNSGDIKLTSTEGNIFFRNTSNLFPIGPFITVQTLAPSTGIAGNITVKALLGDILLADNTNIFTSVNGNSMVAGGGGIEFVANNLTMNNSFVQIDNFVPVVPGNITVNVSGQISLSSGSIIQTTTRSPARSADLNITAHDVLLTEGSFLSTETFAAGDAGTLNIFAQNLELKNGAQLRSSSTFGSSVLIPTGNAGTINIQGLDGSSGSIVMEGTDTAIFTDTQHTGNAGNINISTENLHLSNGAQISSGSSIGMIEGQEPVIPTGSGGTINIGAGSPVQSIVIEGADSGFFTDTVGTGDAGNINILAENLQLTDGGQLSSRTSIGDFPPGEQPVIPTGSGGTINIGVGSPVQSLVIEGTDSGFFTDTVGTGDAGSIIVNAIDLTMEAGAEISSSSTRNAADAGDAGSVKINASNSIALSATSINTSAAQGAGGAIAISAGQDLQLTNQTTVSADSSGAGNSGTVTLVATSGSFQSNNSRVSTTAQEAAGGDIAITAGQEVNLTNNTLVSAESFGPGNAGDITLTSGHDINMTNSTISTEAAQASGGNVKLSAPNIIQLTDSRIESSVVGGQATEGGNIDLDPEFIILTNSKILANATAGNGGNITLTATGAVFIDANSVLDASSETGISGNVTVNSPIVALAEVVAALPKNFVIPQSLFADACAAQAGGQFSSFTQGAPAALPPAPGGFLSSPLMLNNLSTPPSTGGTTQSSTLAQSRLGLDFSSISLLPAFGCGA